jgi:hypothetical protein
MFTLDWIRGQLSRFGYFLLGRSRRRSEAGRNSISLFLERLEDRTVPSVFTVKNTNDSGPESLRQAILDANTAATGTALNPDLIQFSIPANDPNHFYYQDDGRAGQVSLANVAATTASDDSTIVGIDPDWAHSWWSIRPTSALPIVTDPVVIDGYTQSGASANTLPVMGVGAGDNAVRRITLDGGRAGPAVDGLLIGGGGSTVRGLVIQNFNNGVHLVVNGSDVVDGNLITSNIFVDDVSSNTIGGTTPAARNLLSSLAIQGSGAMGNLVQGNYIGTNGSGLLSNSGGVFILDASNNTIAGNVISCDGVGIEIAGDIPGSPEENLGAASVPAQGNVVKGNYIGTDAGGTIAIPTLTGSIGIWLIGNAVDNTIGGTTAPARNVISGWSSDFEVDGDSIMGQPSGNQIEGNYIGTDATGSKAVVCHEDVFGFYPAGVVFSAGIGNTIADNVISGMVGVAINLSGDGNKVQGNLIGTDATGTQPLPNGFGVIVLGGSNNIIGGTGSGAANTIAFNRNWGVAVGGTGVAAIEGNSIYANAGLGIDLGRDGVTLNTPGGPHTGPNHLQNFPVLKAASSSDNSATVSGTLNSTPNHTFRLEFFANASPDPSGYGQGQTFLGSAEVITDGNGDVTFSTTLPTPILAGMGYVTATATDEATGDTSEFSKDFTVPAGDLAPVTSQTLQSLISSVAPAGTSTTVVFQAPTSTEADTLLGVVNGLAAQAAPAIVILNLASGTYTDVTASPPAGVTLVINGNGSSRTIVGHSPALTVASGNVIISGVTFTTATDAPTILVAGGHLTLRNDVIQESTGFTDAAISITGGTVDLGTATDPGGNTININGTGTFIRNTTANTIVAVGDTFEINGQVTAWPVHLTVTIPSSIMLVGNNPPPLSGSVNGMPFTGSSNYTTAFGDTVTVALSTTATSASPVGQYAITASLSSADAGNYVIDPATSTVGTMYVVSLGADPSSTTGAEGVVFWDNKGNARLITGADLSSLDVLNLVTQGGSAFDPKAVQQLQAWLSTSPSATVSYQLAVQLAVMDLNVLTGYVHTTDLVYAGSLLAYQAAYSITGLTSGGFISVQDLMAAANSMLALDPRAVSGDPNQAYEAALALVLQAANGNSDFVSQEVLWNLVGLYPAL